MTVSARFVDGTLHPRTRLGDVNFYDKSTARLISGGAYVRVTVDLFTRGHGVADF